MINNITIRNFRQFEELTVSNLGQFNLILGDNNSGKTSLLEALAFTPDKIKYSEILAFCYAERLHISSFDTYQNPIKNHANFVSDFALDTNQPLEFNVNGEEFKFSKNDCNSLSVLEDFTFLKNSLIPFVASGKGAKCDLTDLYYSKISTSKSKRLEFIENLKIFIPDIETITGSDNNGIGIETSNKNVSTPLHRFGGCVEKFFNILIQISLHKDGILLIDDIDFGIHFTKFHDLWKTILIMAHKNNVQLFVTTHNLECIESFKGVLDEVEYLKEQSKIIALRNHSNNEVKSYTYKYEEFSYAIENGSNVYRGGKL